MMEKKMSYLSDTAILILDFQSFDILDVNEQAVELYGYSYEELCGMNVNGLGTMEDPGELIPGLKDRKNGIDNIWKHQKKNGETFYVQFTHHKFNYHGRPAHFAVVHEVSGQIQREDHIYSEFPNFGSHEKNYPLAEIGCDADLLVTEWSANAEKLFGWSKKEMVGKGKVLKKLIPGNEVEAVRADLKKAISRQVTQCAIEARYVTKKGKTGFCKWYISIIYDEQDRLASLHILAADITKRKESQYLFQALSEESLVGVYLIQDGKFRYVNPRFTDIFGSRKDEIIDKLGPEDLTHPDDRERIMKTFHGRLENAGGSDNKMDASFRCLTKKGKTIDVHIFGSAITYGGRPAFVGTLVDLTHNNKIIKKYQGSLQSYRDLFNSTTDAIYIQDKDGCFLEVNKGAEKMYGYDRETLIGKTPEFLAADNKVDLQETKKFINKAMEGEPQHFRWWGKRKNGETFPKEVVVNKGKYFGTDVVIAVARDITEWHKAEKKLQRREEMFRQLFDNAPVAIEFMDKDHRIQNANQAFTDTFGYSIDDIKGENIDEVIVPEDQKREGYAISEKIYQGERPQAYGKRKRKDGSLIDVVIYGVPVIVDGETIAIFGIYIDITESKLAEEKIKKSLKEKEVLLSEIHHRVKNNLAVVTGLLELQAYNTNSEEARKVLKDSQMRINSIALIHEKLYQREDLTQISFDVYLQELAGVIVSTLDNGRTDVNIHIEADPVDLTISQAIPCGLILNELITNAYKHAFEGRKEGNIHISFNRKGSTVTFLVYDDGKGISDELNIGETDSLGVQLINTLSAQLRGTAEFSNRNPGTQFKLTFDLDKE